MPLRRDHAPRTTSNGFEGGIIYADTKGMLIDRIAALREANVYEKQSYRHILGLPNILNERRRRRAESETPFMVVRIMHDGQSDIFATGLYLDTYRAAGNDLKFAKRARGVQFLAHRHADGAAAVGHDLQRLRPGHRVSASPASRTNPCSTRRSARGCEIPFSCRKGVCGTCKGRVVSGEVRAFAGDALGAAERAEGQALFCNARPRSDLVIAPRSISKADPFARKTVDARVFRLQKLADDVMLVHLRFPAGIRVKFKAGQHLNLILDNGERRDFSMANPPRESDGAQLHIRHVPGGAFTTYVFEKLRRGDR